MTKALLYECFAGISGDMHLGALIDVGVPADYLCQELGRLELAPEFTLAVEAANKLGVRGTKVTVRLAPDAARPARDLAAIKGIIERAGYAPPIRDRAFAMFNAIAAAEAKSHGVPVASVHFHEVGATDSIVDIVGAAIGLHQLAVDAVYCGPVEVGAGTVRCAHGLFPVPAPATAELLKGTPCHYGGVNGEATTPTGAAILKCAVNAFRAPAAFAADAVGYGLGQRDFAIPNALRLTIGEATEAQSAIASERQAALETETNIEVECNIDDMTAEAFAPLMDALFAKGARDVFLTSIVMKKSRPGTKVSVLAGPAELDSVLDELFAVSTTIGVRLREVTKRMLPRRERTVRTPLGDVRVKVVTLPNGATRWKCDHDDIAAIAARAGTAYLAAKADVERNVAESLRGQARERERRTPATTSAPSFTERELAVVNAMERGLPNKEIARSLGLTENGVRYHLKNIYRKTGALSRIDAIRRVNAIATGGSEEATTAAADRTVDS